MREWAVYSNNTGACLGGLGYNSDEISEEEAYEMAEEMYGDDVYVAERQYF